MQSLCLDVKVLDENQEEIDLTQSFEDDDPMPSRSYDDEDTLDGSDFSESELGDAGFGVEGEDDEDGVLDLLGGDDEFSFEEDDVDIDLDSEASDVLDLDDDVEDFDFDSEE